MESAEICGSMKMAVHGITAGNRHYLKVLQCAQKLNKCHWNLFACTFAAEKGHLARGA